MSAEEKKYVYPEVEQDYEETNDNYTNAKVNLQFDTDEKESNNFRLVDLKDDKSVFDRVEDNFREDTYNYKNGLKHCPYCGVYLSRVGTYCPDCGKPLPVESEGRWVNKWVSLALCFFGGVAGAHKFYEGKIGMGVLYLFTGGLFTIGVLVDLVKILLSDDPYYVEK